MKGLIFEILRYFLIKKRSLDKGTRLGWVTLLYNPNRYVPLQRVGFLGLFGLKTGIDFAHFNLESGMVFKGTTVVYERICSNLRNGDISS